MDLLVAGVNSAASPKWPPLSLSVHTDEYSCRGLTVHNASPVSPWVICPGVTSFRSECERFRCFAAGWLDVLPLMLTTEAKLPLTVAACTNAGGCGGGPTSHRSDARRSLPPGKGPCCGGGEGARLQGERGACSAEKGPGE